MQHGKTKQQQQPQQLETQQQPSNNNSANSYHFRWANDGDDDDSIIFILISISIFIFIISSLSTLLKPDALASIKVKPKLPMCRVPCAECAEYRVPLTLHFYLKAPLDANSKQRMNKRQ